MRNLLKAPCAIHASDYVRIDENVGGNRVNLGIAIKDFRVDDEALMFLSREDTIKLRDVLNEAFPLVDQKTTPMSKRLTPRYTNLKPLARKVYQHINRAGSISAREAMGDYGISSASLARRICDLEEEGFEVVRTRKVHPITGRHYTRYSLAPVQVAA